MTLNEQEQEATRWIQKCIGKRLLCTMKDGRQAYGILTCMDRLNNLILTDCTERRILSSTDYLPPTNNNKETTLMVSRSLSQAMIPGNWITRIQMTSDDYNDIVQP